MIIVLRWLLRRWVIVLTRLRPHRRHSRWMQRLIVCRPSGHVSLQSIVLIRNLHHRGLTERILILARVAEAVYHLNVRVIWIKRSLLGFWGWIG